MTGILTQLVGRATGEVSLALRPRLPSRFEQGLRAAVLSDETTDIPVSPAAPSERDEAPAPLRRPAVAPGPAERPLPMDVAPTAARVAPEQPPAKAASAGVSDGRSETPAAPVLPPRRAAMASDARDGTVPPAPSPLLPVFGLDRAQATLIERLREQPRTPGPAAPSGAEPAQQQEITIHIGRLDIRSDAPAPAPPRVPATRSLPSLSEYLRGGRK